MARDSGMGYNRGAGQGSLPLDQQARGPVLSRRAFCAPRQFSHEVNPPRCRRTGFPYTPGTRCWRCESDAENPQKIV